MLGPTVSSLHLSSNPWTSQNLVTQLLLTMCVCVRAQSLLSCPNLCDPMNCGLPSSSVPGTLQARILEWVAISSSRGSSRPRDRSWVSCIAGRFFTAESPGKPSFTVLQLRKAWDFIVITASCFLCVYTNFDSFRRPYGSGFWSTAYVSSTWTLINTESSCQLEILRGRGSTVGTRNLGWILRQ